jgi:outer membrane PBP1 activator LpoA protein
MEDTSGKLRGAEAVEYREIQRLYTAGAFDALINKIAAFEKRFPRSTQTAQVRNLNGMAYLLSKRPTQSVPYFRRSIEASNQPVFKQFVLYNLAYAQFESAQIEDANRTLSEIQPEALDRDTQIKFHSLRSRVFMKVALPLESARETLQLGRLVEESQPRGVFVAQLDQALQNLTDPAVLETLYSEYEDSPFADLVLFRLGSQEFAMGRPGSGEARLKLLMERYPQSSRFSDAQDLLRSVQNQTVVNAKAIGVLLPMKGKFARFGQRSLQGIQLAFRIFNLDQPSSGITLVVEDSGEDADSAVRGLNNLFFKHHVIGVIGPLLSKGIDQVTQRAQELGIPVLTLAQQPGVQGDFVFPSALTPQMQAQAIARHAYENMGVRKFAILSPRDKFGEQYSQAFWDAVEDMGGEVVGAEAYTSGDTDFRAFS